MKTVAEMTTEEYNALLRAARTLRDNNPGMGLKESLELARTEQVEKENTKMRTEREEIEIAAAKEADILFPRPATDGSPTAELLALLSDDDGDEKRLAYVRAKLQEYDTSNR